MIAIRYPKGIETFAALAALGVSEPPPTRGNAQPERGLLQRLVDFLHPGPDTPEDLKALLAQENHYFMKYKHSNMNTKNPSLH